MTTKSATGVDEETTTVMVDGEPYVVRLLSDLELLSAFGTGDKNSGEAYRDIVLLALVEPKLTRDEVSSMRGGKMIRLASAIQALHKDALKSFRESITKIST